MGYRIPRVVVCLVFSILAVTSAFAQAGRPEGPSRRANDLGAPVFDESGFRVVYDASTGRLRRPTPEEIRQYGLTFNQLFNISGKGLVVRQSENGTLAVTLNEDYLDYFGVTMRSDGQLVPFCVTGPRNAALEHSEEECLPALEEK